MSDKSKATLVNKRLKDLLGRLGPQWSTSEKFEVAAAMDATEDPPEVDDVMAFLKAAADKGVDRSVLSDTMSLTTSNWLPRVHRQINLESMAIDKRKSLLAACEEVADFIEQDSVKLQATDCTRVHKLIQASQEHQVLTIHADEIMLTSMHLDSAQVIVVQHDWAAALGPAIEEVLEIVVPGSIPFEIEFRETYAALKTDMKPLADLGETDLLMPYPMCFFEYRISDKNVIALVLQQGRMIPTLILFIENHDGRWTAIAPNMMSNSPVFVMVWRQIVAVSVALSSEVADTAVVAAPAKLNKKRLGAGKVPVADYHVVDLARRFKTRQRGPAEAYKGLVRLHFRRAHDRHYKDKVTRIDWTLVGNPDLGFIDKMYRLGAFKV